MALTEYKRKRDFKKTTEPNASTDITQSDRLHFVIHKHAARRLHYDLRLEIKGVLKSWAIPKGPSLNPHEKHLAIKVEDHPYPYKDFEGVIPKGNYGAGNVMIWDEGEYEIIENKIKSGKFSFVLHGHKLKGAFSLIKLKNNKTQRDAWLLIKIADKYSSTKDILKQNTSVRSGFTIEQIGKATANKIFANLLKSLPKTKMPQIINPMLATLVNEPFTKKNWLFEVKWDGYRIIAFLNNRLVKLTTRNHQDYSKVFMPVSKELKKLNLKAVLDGEMVVVDNKGTPSFQLLQQYQKNGEGNLIYYIFDILWLEGRDLSSLPLIKRKQILQEIITPREFIKISDYVTEQGEDFFKAAAKHELEGIIAKDANSEYDPGKRSKHWLKIKNIHQQEAIICGFTEPRGSRKEIGALILGIYKNHDLVYIGHTGTGFSEATLTELKKRLNRLTQQECPFKKIPKTNSLATWVKPQLVCAVSFSEWTNENVLRHPVFLGLRVDKLARSVRKEQEKPINKVLAEADVVDKNESDQTIIKVNKQPLRLSNLTKVFWPDEGYTKGDVIEYYQIIAPVILPYLKDRPQSLNRHPNGITGKSFYQKNIPHPPKWADTQIIPSQSQNRDIEYLVCQNKETLIYMANLACIEIHPWLSRINSLDYPDFCVIDLDPEGISFEQVIIVARELHKLLENIGADSYCKTSGATGLHICIPLHAKYDYQQSQQFANLIAIAVNLLLPKITSIQRSPKQRPGRVYLDFLQNRYGQTIAAPYSIRAKAKAPISTPLNWNELTRKLSPQQFTIINIFKRLDKIGDLWQPILGKGINLNKCLKNLAQYFDFDDFK